MSSLFSKKLEVSMNAAIVNTGPRYLYCLLRGRVKHCQPFSTLLTEPSSPESPKLLSIRCILVFVSWCF